VQNQTDTKANPNPNPNPSSKHHAVLSNGSVTMTIESSTNTCA